MYNVPFAYVDTKILLYLAEQEFESFSDNDLLQCIANREQVQEAIKNPKHMFKGPYGPVLAAIVI